MAQQGTNCLCDPNLPTYLPAQDCHISTALQPSATYLLITMICTVLQPPPVIYRTDTHVCWGKPQAIYYFVHLHTLTSGF